MKFKSSKKIASIITAICIFAALFSVVFPLPSYAAQDKMIVWDDAPEYSRLLYRPDTGDFLPDTRYMLSFDFELNSLADESRFFAVFYCTNRDSFSRIPHSDLDVKKTALTNGFHYEIVFSVPADCRSYYNILLKFGDVTISGYTQNMKLANLELWSLSGSVKLNRIALKLPESLSDIVEVSSTTQKNNGVYGKWVCPENYLKNISIVPQSDYFSSKPETVTIAGDVNLDGSVDNKDLIRLFKYLSDWAVEVDKGALDVNGDTDINNKDLMRLFQYLSGYDVSIHCAGSQNTQAGENKMKVFSNSSGYDASSKFTGGASIPASELKEKILGAKNTEEIYQITGKKYYMPKGVSLSTIPSNLKAGDAVLFERGGLWRVNETTLTVPEGVIFGAYGEGEKPKFYGSAKNYAKEGVWTDTGNNIWVADLAGGNAGIIVFNEKYALGVKMWEKDELASLYDFYSDDTNKKIYLYCTDNPSEIFDSIEIGQRSDVICVKSGAVLDNVCVRYTGAHGVSVGSRSENITITNCEVSLLGGSRQHDTTRYGNGIEIQLGGKNITVKNNYVYQCYDAGITFQSWNSADMDTYYDGIDFNENLVENCFYNIEFFSTQPDLGGHYTELHNISLRNNILRFAGYCWSYEQRPGHWMTANIRSSQRGWYEETENFVIADNIFDCSRACLVYWWWHSTDDRYVHNAPHPGVSVSGNSFYETNTIDGRVMGYRYELAKNAYNLSQLKTAVAVFDPEPECVVWLDTI